MWHIYAYKQVTAVVTTLEQMRTGSDAEFHKMFTKLGQSLHGEDFELKKPIIVGHRSNPCRCPMHWSDHPIWWVSLPCTLLQSWNIALPISRHKSWHLAGYRWWTILTHVAEYYNDDLPHPIVFPTEYEMWVKKWKQLDRLTVSGI